MFCLVGLSKPVADTHVYKMFVCFVFSVGQINKDTSQNKTKQRLTFYQTPCIQNPNIQIKLNPHKSNEPYIKT